MKYRCPICGYIHDDDNGTRFEDLPDDWVCPLCGAPKSMFIAEGAAETKKKVSAPVEIDEDAMKLSVGQLAALCSNLARGCEMQYKYEEMKLFRELADYYTSITPAVNDADVQFITENLKKDLEERYPQSYDVSKEYKDRGSHRICVWGEKVTRILDSLMERYNSNQEFLKDTEIWICSVCGFVYVGENAPALCPVCKVPDWKFNKVERKVKA